MINAVLTVLVSDAENYDDSSSDSTIDKQTLAVHLKMKISSDVQGFVLYTKEAQHVAFWCPVQAVHLAHVRKKSEDKQKSVGSVGQNFQYISCLQPVPKVDGCKQTPSRCCML